MRFSDQEMEALRAHYGESSSEFDPDLEADLRDEGPEGTESLDDRRRYRRLLDIWAGRKMSGRDVHTSHCCELHGCKYGDKECPVVKRASPQSDLCEKCEDDLFEVQLAGPKAEAYARSVAVMDLKDGNYIIVDGDKLRLTKPDTVEATKAQYADLVWAIQTAYLAGVV